MNAERLLQHYEQIADAPDAIARLRRFILDLAVRGKLVPQDFEEEPASELLKRIAEEKARLLKAGEIRTPKPLSAVVDVTFSIPSNWSWSQIAEIGIMTPRNDAPDALVASFVPMPLIAAEYGVANRHEVRTWGQIKKGYTHFAEGDVGLAKITPCFENGKSTVFRNLTGGIGSGTTELHVVRPLLVVADYILLFWKSPHFIETGIPKMTGTAGQKRVPTDYFANSSFPLPPLAEQRRIVAKVDELMALCDELEAARTERETKRDRLAAASLARLNNPNPETLADDARFALDALPALTARPDQIKQLRQTILNLAVRGKLVPQDPTDEPAEELLKRIAGKKTEKARKSEGRRNGLPDASLRREEELAPDNWTWTQLGAVALSMRYGTSVKCDYGTKGAPVLRIPNVSGGRVSLDDIKFGSLSPSEMEDLSLREGDILLIRSNGSLEIVGRAAVVTPDAAGMSFAGYLVRLRTDPTEIDPAYIWLALQSSEVRDQIEQPIRSAVGLKNVNLTEFGALTFRLPPLAEQHRIVAKVDELMALCDHLGTSLTSVDETRKKLLDTLLAEALSLTTTEYRVAAE
ncbi:MULTISPECIES: restriction endonuclease subunit S [Rhizobium]|uniref:restriction endonuclease subunit S n=1 Tax=Rhizobium TaxID=379 RepID=UPI0028AC4C63